MILLLLNIDFVDVSGVLVKLCKIFDDFLKEKNLIDFRRVYCMEFFWVLYEIVSY